VLALLASGGKAEGVDRRDQPVVELRPIEAFGKNSSERSTADGSGDGNVDSFVRGCAAEKRSNRSGLERRHRASAQFQDQANDSQVVRFVSRGTGVSLARAGKLIRSPSCRCNPSVQRRKRRDEMTVEETVVENFTIADHVHSRNS
jgi:hypothetical protein